MSVQVLYVNQLRKKYEMSSGPLEVLRGLSFSVEVGEFLSIIGESGSGKSTLLHILGTLDSPSQGEVIIGGTNPFSINDKAISRFRNRFIGFVFQHNNLLPEFSALENAMLPALIAGEEKDQLIRERAQHLLSQVGVAHRMNHFPGQLSGGEQQRVAIARALINNPAIVLADEPTGNLDSRNAENIHHLFRDLNEKMKTTLITVTHNLEFAKLAKRRIEIKDGEIISDLHFS